MRSNPGAAQPPRLVDIITVMAVMAAFVVLAGKAVEERRKERSYPPPVTTDAVLRPIASEANVFGVTETEFGIVPDFQGDPAAHIRSLDMYRRLRAYPGAPPRVPHGLTDEEYRGPSCNVCHLRGGWVARFGTYAPVTSHPDRVSCLQCHLPQDPLVGVALPRAGDSRVCGQCHVDPDAALETFVELDWRTVAWPKIGLQAMPGSPNRIPHDVETRNNCLTCHSGPGALVEVRTDHPERVNCRQCHLPAAANVGAFPGASADPGGEGAS